MTTGPAADLDRTRILDAFDMLGEDAVAAGARLDIAVDGGERPLRRARTPRKPL